MNHDQMPMNNNQQEKTSFKNFIPLIIIFCVIIALTSIRQMYSGWNVKIAMSDFMAYFFLIFGTFKIINLPIFVEAYSSYDLIAKHFHAYAYVYPFIEVILGLGYLTRMYPLLINSITLIIMLIGTASVAVALAQKNLIQCACLGALFKLPLTYISLFEDLLMAGMAFAMLMM